MRCDVNADAGVTIYPNPHHVLASKTPEGDVVVNVCYENCMGAPESQNGEYVRIPVSLGPINTERNRHVIDIIVSGVTADASLSNETFRSAFCGVIAESIHAKHGITCVSDWRIVDAKYVGDRVQPQRVNSAKLNLIQEIEDSQSRSDDRPTMPFQMHYKYSSKDECLDVLQERELGVDVVDTRYCGTSQCVVTLPDVSNPALYRLHVSSHRLRVRYSGICADDFDMWFPIKMDPSDALAEYDKQKRTITVTINVAI